MKLANTSLKTLTLEKLIESACDADNRHPSAAQVLTVQALSSWYESEKK